MYSGEEGPAKAGDLAGITIRLLPQTIPWSTAPCVGGSGGITPLRHGYGWQTSKTTLLNLFTGALQAIVLLMSFCFAPFSWASIDSEIYWTRALLAISENNYLQALELLEEAVTDDPDDISARYYRGVTLSRLGQFADAIGDLEEVRASGEAFPRLAFELGYAYYRNGEYLKAENALQQSLQEDPGHAASHYYLGLLYYKQEAYENTLEPLATAARLNPYYTASASYIRGDALTHLGQSDEARTLLADAEKEYPDSVYAEGFDRLIQEIDSRQREERPFSLEVSAGLTADSNVGLFPDEQTATLPEDAEGDVRLEGLLNARYRVFARNDTDITMGYQFFNSHHRHLDKYNILSHIASADLRHTIGKYSLGMNYQFQKAYLDNDDYSDIHTLIPNLAIQHGSSRASLATLQWSDNDYKTGDQEGRTGDSTAFRYRHYWFGKARRNTYLGSGAIYDDTDDRDFRYTGIGLEAGIQRPWLPGWLARADVSYEYRDYSKADPDREDDHYEAALRLIKTLNEQLEMEIAIRGIENSSNDEDYDYTRGLASFLFRWRL